MWMFPTDRIIGGDWLLLPNWLGSGLRLIWAVARCPHSGPLRFTARGQRSAFKDPRERNAQGHTYSKGWPIGHPKVHKEG